MSAAFFILGGSLQDACNVIVDKLNDIQLALLACKLIETDKDRPTFTRLVKDHFIEAGKITNDCFLHHIGYNLLGQHVNSINCLYEFTTERMGEVE